MEQRASTMNYVAPVLVPQLLLIDIRNGSETLPRFRASITPVADQVSLFTVSDAKNREAFSSVRQGMSSCPSGVR